MKQRSHLGIGEAASAAGVNVQTLHYYERRGLIRAAARTEKGYRRYTPAIVNRVRAIKRAQTLGFTLEEIHELASLRRRGKGIGALAELVSGKLRELDEKMRALETLRTALVDVVKRCGCAGDLSRCDVLAELGALPDDEQASVNGNRAARRLDALEKSSGTSRRSS
jgi:DNA-binding transcriptional MerR regulator